MGLRRSKSVVSEDAFDVDVEDIDIGGGVDIDNDDGIEMELRAPSIDITNAKQIVDNDDSSIKIGMQRIYSENAGIDNYVYDETKGRTTRGNSKEGNEEGVFEVKQRKLTEEYFTDELNGKHQTR